jgi:hypothetical protein
MHVAIGNAKHASLGRRHLPHEDTSVRTGAGIHYISLHFHAALSAAIGRTRHWHVGAGSVDSAIWCRGLKCCLRNLAVSVRCCSRAWQMDVINIWSTMAALYGLLEAKALLCLDSTTDCVLKYCYKLWHEAAGSRLQVDV